MLSSNRRGSKIQPTINCTQGLFDFSYLILILMNVLDEHGCILYLDTIHCLHVDNDLFHSSDIEFRAPPDILGRGSCNCIVGTVRALFLLMPLFRQPVHAQSVISRS